MYLKVSIKSTNLKKYYNYSGMLIGLSIAILYFVGYCLKIKWFTTGVMKTLHIRVSSTSQNLAIFVPFCHPVLNRQ